MHIEPTADQLRALAQADPDHPVVMLNLLRFRPGGGADSYRRYGESVVPILTAIGARVVWQGTAEQVVIGDPDGDLWHQVLLVEYPSPQAFLDMVRSADYQAVAHLRSEGLADSRLVACRSASPPAG